MSKNQKVILASVGVIVTLILMVLMIRSPVEKQVASKQPKQVVTTPAPKGVNKVKIKEMDDSHKKIANIVDEASTAVVKETPGMWGRVVHTWDWFLAFDTKHAIILIGVMVFVVGMIASGGGRNKRSQH